MSLPVLSSEAKALVKGSIPVLETQGEALTRHFYQRLFQENPGVRAFFNPAHQHAGSQQRALAAAICGFARHVDDLDALRAVVDRIAHKHVSLQVQPEHYPIVGRTLLGAIQDLLGDAATPELLSAWEEAYGLLAAVLIDQENRLYRQQTAAPNGWNGFRALHVHEIRQEADSIRSFLLSGPEGTQLPPFLPGQYLTLRLPLGEAGTTMRNYSLSGSPNWPHYRISVKRERGDGGPDGLVSNYLHEHIQQGHTLEVAPPCGEFTLDVAALTRPVCLIAGGIGITPLLSMLHTLAAHPVNLPVTFVLGCRDAGQHPFREEVDQLMTRLPNGRLHYRYSHADPTAVTGGQCHDLGFLDENIVQSLGLDLNADFYFCGPPPMMARVERGLAQNGVPEARRHFEFFGPHDPKA